MTDLWPEDWRVALAEASDPPQRRLTVQVIFDDENGTPVSPPMHIGSIE